MSVVLPIATFVAGLAAGHFYSGPKILALVKAELSMLHTKLDSLIDRRVVTSHPLSK